MRPPLRGWLWGAVIPLLAFLAVVLDRPRASAPVHRAEWLQAGDAQVRAVRAGAGDTTLLLLHGFGESLFTWRAVVDPLALRFRVIAIDLPGFGGSTKPDTTYSLEAMTARLTDFLDRWVETPDLVLVGHSLGGQLAAALALERPERVRSVVLIAPAGWGVGLGGIADTMYPSKARAIGWYLSSRAFLLPEHDPDWLGEPDSAAAYTLTTDAAYRRATARILQELDFRGLRTRYRLLRQPALVLWGKLDPVIPFALADTITAEMPCARLVSFNTALHRPQVEIPDTVAAAISSFVGSEATACSR